MQDADVRLARRIRRDTVERGRDINSVLEQASLPFPFLISYFIQKSETRQKWRNFSHKIYRSHAFSH